MIAGLSRAGITAVIGSVSPDTRSTWELRIAANLGSLAGLAGPGRALAMLWSYFPTGHVARSWGKVVVMG